MIYQKNHKLVTFSLTLEKYGIRDGALGIDAVNYLKDSNRNNL